ncbi:N-acetyltransferase [Bacillus sp. J14TS2]|uniref:GNAT family N-acetyltransferase n=1 Tax=Bacillus sp. J14TS2 TaxID=2807188 RepID=UPI001AFF9564|nr:GNAT family N-acetyltransferase [Bacillus sp. J14TS2]GIN72028.1 N-acetyltransferase [Bacillus sp. J14TS2]
MNEQPISIRLLTRADFNVIEAAFKKQGWYKPASQFEQYALEQDNGERVIFVAEYVNEFAGYVTIKWQSTYPPFLEKGIPEIVDLNVLIHNQNKGIATKLMDEAERIVADTHPVIGIGFGLMEDYGAAQRLYISRGYLPDGRGISQNGKQIKRGEQVQVDDDLALYLTKAL